MAKKKAIKGKEKKRNTLIDSSFLNKVGDSVKVADFVSEEDCWFLKRGTNKWVLTHSAIKTIANAAGISKNYDVEESPNISPDYKNELEHIVRVTIRCKAKIKSTSTSCVHSDEDTLTVTGEANRVNTPHRGRGYLRKMAEKRAFDIAVLEHLELYTAIFSEEESEDFERDTSKRKKEATLLPGSKEFQFIATEVNSILNSTTKKELAKAAALIKKGIKTEKYSVVQVIFLRELYGKEHAKRSQEF